MGVWIMAFIRDESGLEAAELYFVTVGGFAFLMYKMWDVYALSAIRDVAARI